MFILFNPSHQILEYTKGMSDRDFYSNRLVIDAVIRNFEVIGEASKRVSSELRKSNPEIPWNRMAGFRDKLIHDYIKVNLQLVWDVIVDVLPEQKKEIEKIIALL
ncbi:MAG TPA: DUF86 domain-containing protein [Cyclobacteriaceae bacterium]|nr:DUF86 domain-containing protein [Cyclobacteriaceae bacterium]